MTNWLNNTFYDIDFKFARVMHIIESNCGKVSTYFMYFISFLGTFGLVPLVISIVLCLFKSTRKAGATALIAIALSYVISSIIIKPLVVRSRPFTLTDTDYYTWWLNTGKYYEKSTSFPSGHVSASMAFALALFARSKNKKLALLFLLFPLLMVCSRTYLMVHFLSDCLFGLIVGIVSAVIAYYLTHLLYDNTKGKFNNCINNFDITDCFNKNNKK